MIIIVFQKSILWWNYTVASRVVAPPQNAFTNRMTVIQNNKWKFVKDLGFLSHVKYLKSFKDLKTRLLLSKILMQFEFIMQFPYHLYIYIT